MRYQLLIHCCKRPNYGFWILQGNVVTVRRWGSQNCSHLRQDFSWCRVPKMTIIGQCYMQFVKKVSLL